MFICDECWETSKPGQPAIKVVTEIRRKEYAGVRNRRGEPATGWEIVSEATVCSKACSQALLGEIAREAERKAGWDPNP